MKAPFPIKHLRARAGSAVAAAFGLTLVLVSATSEEHAGAGPAVAPPAAAPPPAAPAAAAASRPVMRALKGEVVPPDVSDLEHMCALLTSCEKLPIPPSLVPADFATCVEKMGVEMSAPSAVGFSLMMRECGLESNSCAALRSCALRGANPDACAGRGKQAVVGFCDVDGRALACWHEQVLAVRDCPRGGEQCVVVEGQATCTLGPCPAGVEGGDKARGSASGRHLLHCEKGKLASLDCAAFGLHCGTGADGTAGCATGGPACTGLSKRCDANVALGCYNGHEVKVDCGAAGLTCASSPGNTPVGACFSPAPPPTDSCDLGDRGRCDGANIKYCYAGKSRSYPCRSLGFGRCDATGGSVRCAG